MNSIWENDKFVDDILRNFFDGIGLLSIKFFVLLYGT